MRAHLGAEAVSDRTNLRDVLLGLDPVKGVDDNFVDNLGGVRVVPGRAPANPLPDVEARRQGVEGELVTVEEVGDDAEEAVGGELVSDELTVLPDAENVGHVEDSGTVGIGLFGFGNVGGKVANLDVGASGSTPADSRLCMRQFRLA